MQIKIKQKFNIISHRLGTKFLIVNSTYFVQIFPGLLHFKDLNSDKNFKIFLEFIGPVKNFTIFQDLQNGNIKVSFQTQQGFLSYKIFNSEKATCINFERLPHDELSIKLDKTKKIKPKTSINLPIAISYTKKPEEFLFLGIHKKQDLDFINKRENFMEILPFLFLYSQFFKNVQTKKCLRENCIVRELKEKIQNRKRNEIEDQFIKVYKAHFSDSFIPRVNDEDFQNIIPIIKEKDASPLHILRKLFYIIKSILIDQKLDEISILPAIPISFHTGKALNINLPIGSFDIEWSKKLIKKLIFRPKKDIKLKLHFQSKITTYRLKIFIKQKGKFFKNRDFLSFEKDKTYYFDKFQK
ncbi:MAG: hypothetical protein KR126chlam4_00087 [Candidatus Anoxychlamydiales bacterium]|nr:hypothetical protein [Candidatus Anoxychlamydiales bacterium]NGX40270.1 hypothetical protein [Candidatus Anoxychlamydiales bacterium]